MRFSRLASAFVVGGAVALNAVACAPHVQGNVMHEREHETAAATRSTLPPELSAEEAARLQRGETIIREQTWSRGDRRYVGGLTYTVVDVGAGELSAVLEDVDAYRRVLPKTKEARLVGMSGNDRLVEVVQGNALVQATYTMRVRSEPVAPSGQREVRFWLEPTLPHEIDDAWGFFRVEPFIGENGNPRVLLTYGVLVDVGAGIVRDLFEERVRSALLSVPQLVRRYVAEVRRSY